MRGEAARGTDPDDSGSGACRRPECRLDVWTRDGCGPSSARFSDRRRAEGRHDRSVRVSAQASGGHRPAVEGGQLLRPSLLARRRVVPGSLPQQAVPPGRAGPGRCRPGRRRGQPELPVPPARAATRRRAASGRARDRAGPESDRPGAVALPPRGRARTRAPPVRAGARAGGNTNGRRARAHARPALLQPHVVELHLPVTRSLRRAARALARGRAPRAAARRRERRPARAAWRDVRARARLPRRAGTRAPVVSADLRARLSRHGCADEREAPGLLRRAEPPPVRAPGPRPRLELVVWPVTDAGAGGSRARDPANGTGQTTRSL